MYGFKTIVSMSFVTPRCIEKTSTRCFLLEYINIIQNDHEGRVNLDLRKATDITLR